MEKNKIIILTLFLLLLGDLIFSFLQYYSTPLYGDIENGALPDQYVSMILADPLGFHTILTGEKHPNPNRFFSHFMLYEYFRNIPFLFQKITDPVSSIYLSCALLKIMIQALFVFSLSAFISGTKNIFSRGFLSCAVIIAPLFQAYGFYSRMGINDKAIAYVFFYAMPIVLLMLFFIPVFKAIFYKKELKAATIVALIPLTIILPLSGPLNSGIILIVAMLIFAGQFARPFSFNNLLNHAMQPSFLLVLAISFCSLYFLYLGTYDSLFKSESIPIIERYRQLPKGIFSQVFHSLGFPLLLIILGVNYLLLRNNRGIIPKIYSSYKWVFWFSVIYILLLPLGGYRPYRPLIIRYDTFIPVTIGLIYLWGLSTFSLINSLSGKRKLVYLVFVAFVLTIYTYADSYGLKKNQQERMALNIIAHSTDSIVQIPKGFQVMSWEDISDPQKSENKAEFLYRMGVTDQKRLFYNDTH